MQHSAFNMRHATCDAPHATFSLQHSHATCSSSIQHAAVALPTCNRLGATWPPHPEMPTPPSSSVSPRTYSAGAPSIRSPDASRSHEICHRVFAHYSPRSAHYVPSVPPVPRIRSPAIVSNATRASELHAPRSVDSHQASCYTQRSDPHTPCNVQRAEFDAHRAPCDVRRATHNTHRATDSMQHATRNHAAMKTATCIMQRGRKGVPGDAGEGCVCVGGGGGTGMSL